MKNDSRSTELGSLCRMIAARNLPVVSVAAMGLALAMPAQAADIYVTAGAVDINNNGNCSIVEAILTANTDAPRDACVTGDGYDTVILPANSTFTLSNPVFTVPTDSADKTLLPRILSDIAIEGNGSTLARDGAAVNARLLRVENYGSLFLNNTVITGGNNTKGSAIYVTKGFAYVTDSTISGNSSPAGADAGAALMVSNGVMVISGSTVSGNNLSGVTLAAPIIVEDRGVVAVATSTVSGNTSAAGVYGAGGVLSQELGTAYIYSSTIANNTLTYSPEGAGGVYNAQGAVLISDSIVSGNTFATASSNCGNDSFDYLGTTYEGDFDAHNANLSSDNSCAAFGFTLNNTNPLLGPLQNNGGNTLTHALLAGSPAIDAATDPLPPCCDQRGLFRPQGPASDLGAYETPGDTIPNAFSFPNVPGVVVNDLIKSKPIVLTGYDTPTSVQVGVAGGEYRVDAGAWRSSPGMIAPGQTLQLRMLSAATPSTGRNMSVTVGGVRATFTVKTRATGVDTDPDPMRLLNTPNAPLNTLVSSKPYTPTGYDTPSPLTIAPACEYSINGGPYTNAAGTLTPTDSLRLRKTTPNTGSTQFTCVFYVGGIQGRWVGKTAP